MKNSNLTSLPKRAIIAIRHRFSLIEDKADDAVIDSSIRNGVELRGTNLWVLMFAILIASIGLNVNSTAVIIGAMLISPLMGPIMGIGYGVGIYDAQLIRKSFRNLGIATGISLLVSTLYFLISPLSDAQSELLARTTPTIWDVLIAFFGGLAGIIAATRNEKTNVIPGVAIATALMPPLCTAGFGLATGNLHYFFGAIYLYSINCVYIAFSAILIIWVLNPTHQQFVDKKTESKMRRILSAVVVVTMLPSIYLAVHLVKQELFDSQARTFLAQEPAFAESHIATTDIDPSKQTIEITLIGNLISKAKLQEIDSRLKNYGLTHAKLVVHQAKDQSIDLTALKSTIVSDLYKDNLVALDQKNKKIEELTSQLKAVNDRKIIWEDVSAELSAQYPQVLEVYLSEATLWKKGQGKISDDMIVLNVKTSSKINSSAIYNITQWLKVRLKSNNIKVIID